MLPWKLTLPTPVYTELASCTQQQLKYVKPKYLDYVCVSMHHDEWLNQTCSSYHGINKRLILIIFVIPSILTLSLLESDSPTDTLVVCVQLLNYYYCSRIIYLCAMLYWPVLLSIVMLCMAVCVCKMWRYLNMLFNIC